VSKNICCAAGTSLKIEIFKIKLIDLFIYKLVKFEVRRRKTEMWRGNVRIMSGN
jgi:hypothetical protein